ncbi:hypothetical protein HaLaN_14578, partial [Haematococcus lacustris]
MERQSFGHGPISPGHVHAPLSIAAWWAKLSWAVEPDGSLKSQWSHPRFAKLSRGSTAEFLARWCCAPAPSAPAAHCATASSPV